MTRVIHIWTLASLANLHLSAGVSETLAALQEKGLPSRPNSTDKLNIANLMALELIESDFNFVNLHSGRETFSEDFFANIEQGDFIHLHTGPNAHSDFLINFLIENLAQLRALQVRLIFGTEVTWKQKVDAGVLEESKLVELMKFAFAILGHTPKTHTYLYALDPDSEINFVEFPLGLLPASPSNEPVESPDPKKALLGMVLPQPGRAAKGEELHQQIVELMTTEALIKDWHLEILDPPYSSQEFTDFASRCDVMVNTSLGETFSYQIQEARALGTPVLHPTSTYISRRGEDFIECWPEFGLDFANLEELTAMLNSFVEPDLLSREGARQRSLAVNYFSIEKLGQSFSDLYVKDSKTNCAVAIACSHRIVEAEALQVKCCEGIHTIVVDDCESYEIAGDSTPNIQLRFSQGHASYFDELKSIIYRRATLVKDSEGSWSKVSNDSVWGITLDRTKVAAREVAENPGLFERMLLRLARASKINRFSCD
jgi:hypothetical protein